MGNRDKLLQAARDCLLSLGYAKTTVRELVKASGANQASINYHFGSKERLLTDTLHDLNREWGDILFAALGGDDPPGPAGNEARWDRIVTSIRDNRALWYVNFESVSAARDDEEIQAMIANGQRMARRSLARAFGGLDPDSDDPDTVEAVGSHYFALLVGVASQWLADPDNAPDAARIVAADTRTR
ncbi:TetR/AcrR family transcriptional regulator [Nocardia cyriacigeorgica]|uniref:TetR/AcrR family transcriptional regulator n=1 Tax=Nocardia cyriacigeorgica TaxID=135487 RepID=UPI0013BB818B|nr:TetR/AcrR family transcriptional regulator [Nocardia cyriacigeorgica]NEW48514.1 TetR/AcrR family transcriptional regulator [Nocardia cyriacigeorgica]